MRPKARSDTGWPDIIGGCSGIVLGIVVWVFQGHDAAFRVAAVAVGVAGVREIVVGIIRRRELAGVPRPLPAEPTGAAGLTGRVAVERHREISTLSEMRRLWREILASFWSVVFAVLGFTRGLPWIGVLGSLGIVLMLILLQRRWREPGAGD